MLNSSGDSTHPCRSPCSTSNKSEQTPSSGRTQALIPSWNCRRRCLERKRARHRNRSRGGLYVFKGDYSRLLSKTRHAGTLLFSDVTLPNPRGTTTCVQNPRRSSGLVGNLHTC
ncbi:unnamed protein product [Ascophyllum nodosum]